MPQFFDDQIDKAAHARFDKAFVGIEDHDLCLVGLRLRQDLPEAAGCEIGGDEEVGQESDAQSCQRRIADGLAAVEPQAAYPRRLIQVPPLPRKRQRCR